MNEGPLTAVVDLGWGELPPGTLLTGALVVGETRFFGRFTQAQTPDRKTYPVCIQVIREARRGELGSDDYCPVGVGDCPLPGSKSGAVKVFPRLEVETTDRFK
jgi:serine/threonine-protein kinase